MLRVNRVVFALLLTLMASHTSAQSAVDILSQARARLEQHDLSHAAQLISPLITSNDAETAAQALFLQGLLYEQQFDFTHALESYRASQARKSGSEVALRVSARLDYLSARDDQHFQSLATLERIRNTPTSLQDPVQLRAFAQQARLFTSPLLRAESLLLAAQHLDELGFAQDAESLLRIIANDRAIPDDQRFFATEMLAQTPTASPRITASELQTLGAPSEQIQHVRTLERRRSLTHVCITSLAVFALWGLAQIVQCIHRRQGNALKRLCFRLVPTLQIALFSAGGALLSYARERHDPRAFLSLGLGTWIVYLLACAWSLSPHTATPYRVFRGLVSALAVFAIAFVSLQHYDPTFLEGVGL